MRIEANYDRNAYADSGYSEEKGADYYKKYEQSVHTFKGEITDATILYARNQLQEKKNKRGGVYYQEELAVIFLNPLDNKWFRVRIKGATLQKDGTLGHNPVRLQDFLQLCEMQRPNCVSVADHHAFDYEGNHIEYDSYPNMIGLKFKIVSAVAGKFNEYDVVTHEVFNPQGFSFVELQNGMTKPKDIEQKLAELKDSYEKYFKEFVEVHSENVPVEEVEMAQPVEPNNATDDDDMPF